MRDLKKIDVDDVVMYLEKQLDAVEEFKDNDEDVEEELLRIEGMIIIVYHFNVINAIQFSYYCDKIEDLKYSLD